MDYINSLESPFDTVQVLENEISELKRDIEINRNSFQNVVNSFDHVNIDESTSTFDLNERDKIDESTTTVDLNEQDVLDADLLKKECQELKEKYDFMMGDLFIQLTNKDADISKLDSVVAVSNSRIAQLEKVLEVYKSNLANIE